MIAAGFSSILRGTAAAIGVIYATAATATMCAASACDSAGERFPGENERQLHNCWMLGVTRSQRTFSPYFCVVGGDDAVQNCGSAWTRNDIAVIRESTSIRRIPRCECYLHQPGPRGAFDAWQRPWPA